MQKDTVQTLCPFYFPYRMIERGGTVFYFLEEGQYSFGNRFAIFSDQAQ